MTSLITVLAMALTSAAAGFKNGNQIDIKVYSGRVHVRCNVPGHIGGTYFCKAADFNPGSHDRFSYGQSIDADKVELIATHADGSDRKKSEKYDATADESGRFNLGISTLTQRPLLELGANQIQYKMKKGSRVVAEGSFTASMEITDDLVCRDGYLYAWGQAQCDNSSWACDEYFARQSESDCR